MVYCKLFNLLLGSHVCPLYDRSVVNINVHSAETESKLEYGAVVRFLMSQTPPWPSELGAWDSLFTVNSSVWEVVGSIPKRGNILGSFSSY